MIRKALVHILWNRFFLQFVLPFIILGRTDNKGIPFFCRIINHLFQLVKRFADPQTARSRVGASFTVYSGFNRMGLIDEDISSPPGSAWKNRKISAYNVCFAVSSSAHDRFQPAAAANCFYNHPAPENSPVLFTDSYIILLKEINNVQKRKWRFGQQYKQRNTKTIFTCL